jgi:hypothetical protein
MDRIALHLEIRNALELSDELSRHEHARGDDELAGNLSALRSTLGELERVVGRTHASAAVPSPLLVDAARRSVSFLVLAADGMPAELRPRLGQLVSASDRVVFALERPSELVKSKPLLGTLPLARLIPQDVHSVLDYVSSATCAASAVVASSPIAKTAGAVLAASDAGVSAMTDYRLSAAKVIPIEVHETIDYAWGAMAICAPFVLGYAKKEPLAAMLQIFAGATTILASLVTDYRACRGVTWPIRSKGGPDAAGKRKPGRVEGEVQRPLEGLSGDLPSVWGEDAEVFGVDPMSR